MRRADAISVTNLKDIDLAPLIDQWLAEDIGPGDLTSETVIPADARLTAKLVAREDFTLAGLPVAERIFSALDANVKLQARARDGESVLEGDVLLNLEGKARALLTAERTALNILQHLSGIATLTRRFVDEIRGTGATLLDTRKTTPGLRALEKYATRMGGAKNHRMGLYDAILIKDNHVAIAGGDIAAAVRKALQSGKLVEVECDTLEQVKAAVEAGANRILLDNMEPDEMRQAVALCKNRAETEASGGITLDTIRAAAETGVNFISVGRITQSAPAVDIGMDYGDA